MMATGGASGAGQHASPHRGHHRAVRTISLLRQGNGQPSLVLLGPAGSDLTMRWTPGVPRISGPRVLARIAPIHPPASNVGSCSPVKKAIDSVNSVANPSSGQADPGHPGSLPPHADAMFLHYKEHAGAGRSRCGENPRPTPVQSEFIPPWSQQPTVYPEVPVNERTSAVVSRASGRGHPALPGCAHIKGRPAVVMSGPARFWSTSRPPNFRDFAPAPRKPA